VDGEIKEGLKAPLGTLDKQFVMLKLVLSAKMLKR
jgi:hypothetical protein